MRVLVACEASGVVRRAFREQGQDAWSCDLLPADDGSRYHIEGDCVPVLAEGGFDLVIMHPSCQFLAVSGNAHYARGKPGYPKRIEAIEWTMALWELTPSGQNKLGPSPDRWRKRSETYAGVGAAMVHQWGGEDVT